MINAYIRVLQKYAVFNGRANRPEYWWFSLMNIIISAILIILALAVSEYLFVILVGYFIAILVPSLAVTVRRLHDSGKSAWWLLIQLVPFGSIVMFIFMVLGSDAGENKHGPEPS